jgi:predicted aspartyl protease
MKNILMASLASIALMALLTQGAHAAVTMTTLKDGHLVVPTYVNGAGPYPFVLDSGADTSIVYQWFADKAGLKAAGESVAMAGMTGKVSLKPYRIVSLKMDGHEIQNVVAYALPNRHDGARIAGILGNDFMDHTVTVMDFPCGRVKVQTGLSDLKHLVGNAAPIHARRPADDTLLSFPVYLNGVRGIGVLDTGNRLTKINHRFAKQAGLDLSSGQFHDAEAIYGISAKRGLVPKQGPIGDITIGKKQMTGVQGEVIDIATFAMDFGKQPVMQIGSDMVGRFRLVYQHSANKFWLLPSTCTR